MECIGVRPTFVYEKKKGQNMQRNENAAMNWWLNNKFASDYNRISYTSSNIYTEFEWRDKMWMIRRIRKRMCIEFGRKKKTFQTHKKGLQSEMDDCEWAVGGFVASSKQIRKSNSCNPFSFLCNQLKF